MTANADEAGVITTQSGLQYKVLEEGEGDSATADDVALINYTGMLTDGEVFEQNERETLPVDGVVLGLSEGLHLMKRGGKSGLWILPQFGYAYDVPEGVPIPKEGMLRGREEGRVGKEV